MESPLPVADLQALMEYSPRDGGLYWKERDAATYYNNINDIDEAEALRLSRMFNSRFAGKECGTTRNGNKDFIRVSIGTRGPNIRRARLDLIWCVATGALPDGQVILINDDKPSTPDNIICCSSRVAQIFYDTSVGIHPMPGRTERYFWRINAGDDKLYQESGYESLEAARQARDAKLKALGFWQVKTLEETLHG